MDNLERWGQFNKHFFHFSYSLSVSLRLIRTFQKRNRSENFTNFKRGVCNIHLNRFADLNNLIDKGQLSLSLDTDEIKCKDLFLGNGTNND